MDTPVAGVRVIAVGDAMDAGTGARLLRLLDSQFALARSGHRRLDAVVVDLHALRTLDRGGMAALTHARFACRRRGIDLVLAGCSPSAATTDVFVRARLREFRTFPTVDAAVSAAARG